MPAFAAGVLFSLAAGATSVDETLERIYLEHQLQGTLPSVDVEVAPPVVAGAGWPLWLPLAVVAAVLLTAWLATVDWARLRERRQGRADTVAARTSANNDQDGLDAADAHAREGRYGAAIHALLLGVLRGLADVQRWPAAATAREIASKHLPTEDLRLLVSAAELAHFAGRPASEADYLACRARARRLRQGASRSRGKHGD